MPNSINLIHTNLPKQWIEIHVSNWSLCVFLAVLNGVEGDHVTLSGHGSGSLGNKWGDGQLGQSPRVPRLSEAALPVTHTSDMMPGKTDIGGPDRLICSPLI